MQITSKQHTIAKRLRNVLLEILLCLVLFSLAIWTENKVLAILLFYLFGSAVFIAVVWRIRKAITTKMDFKAIVNFFLLFFLLIAGFRWGGIVIIGLVMIFVIVWIDSVGVRNISFTKVRQWLICSLSLCLLVLCVVVWRASYSFIVIDLSYGFGNLDRQVDIVPQSGILFMQYSRSPGLNNWHKGCHWQYNPYYVHQSFMGYDDPLNAVPQPLGFGFSTLQSTSDMVTYGVGIPFWFLAILSALALFRVWRKTQPSLNMAILLCMPSILFWFMLLFDPMRLCGRDYLDFPWSISVGIAIASFILYGIRWKQPKPWHVIFCLVTNGCGLLLSGLVQSGAFMKMPWQLW